MAFYYVKSGGTATGDAGRSETARTGSFAAMGVSAYYPSVKSIYADQPTTGNTIIDGDNIIMSNDHVETYASATTIGILNTTNEEVSTLISMDVNDVSIYKKGAKISTDTEGLKLGSALDRNNYAVWKGVYLHATTSYVNPNTDDSIMVFIDCDIFQTQYFYYFSECRFYGCSIECSYLRSGSTTRFYECIIKCNYTAYNFRSCTSSFYNCDFSTTAKNTVFAYLSTCKLYNCKFNSSIPNYISYDRSMGVEMYGCGNSDEYYDYTAFFWEGTITTNLFTYLYYKYGGNASASIKMETTAYPHIASPLKVKLCELPAQNLSVTDTTYRVNLLLDTDTAATLTDTTCWVELSHNDNTSLALGKVVSSRNTDILATGTELTPSAEVWQGTLPTNTKAYQIDITLSAASLPNVTNGNVVIYLNLAVANTDVYACPAVMIGT